MKDEIHSSFSTLSKWNLSVILASLEQSWIVRLLLGAIVSSLLCFFLYSHNIRFDIPPINTISKKEIIAPFDFQFLDESRINLTRQEAIKDLGKIYKVNYKDFKEKRLEFENYLSSTANIEEISIFLNLLERAFVDARYTDGHTLLKRKELGIGIETYILFTPETTSRPIELPRHVWEELITIACPNKVPLSSLQAFIIDFFQSKQWLLEKDLISASELRSAIQTKPLEIYKRIPAGFVIVEKGNKISAQHVAMLRALQQAIPLQAENWNFPSLCASIFLTILLLSIGRSYIKSFCDSIFTSNKQLALLSTIAILTISIAKILEYVWLCNSHYLEDFFRYPIIVPFAAILISILVNVQLAFILSFLLSIILAFCLAFNTEEFLILNLLSSIVVILSMHRLHRRKDVFIVAMKGWVSCATLITTFYLYDSNTPLLALSFNLLSTFLFFIHIYILVVSFLPIFESFFCIITDLSLMEYMDPSNHLLRRLSIEAPGTYQHTLAVANLAESAALAIHANGLFCRVAALYHDIGKLNNPSYFVENQQTGISMHQLLTPLESAQVIIRHVEDGVTLARKDGLPEPFIQIIQEHHGTTSTNYFYMKQCELVGKDAVDERLFQYAGPKPQTKESAIIMIVDGVEAASRCLDDFSEAAVRDFVEKLVAHKAGAGQFDDCPLTFEELFIIKENIVSTIVASSHARIKYPINPLSIGNVTC